jgi:hypothetical protein
MVETTGADVDYYSSTTNPDYSTADLDISGSSYDETVTGTQIPEYLADASKQIIEQGMSLIGGGFPEFQGARFKTYSAIPGLTGDVAGAVYDQDTGKVIGSKMSPAEQEAYKIMMESKGDYSALMDQITGSEGLLTGLGQGYAPGMAEEAAQAGMTTDQYLRSYLEGDPFSIANVQDYLDVYTDAMNPAIRQIQEQTALGQQAARDRAATAGAFGGSRLGLMEATLGAEGIQSEADLLAQAGADALGFAAGRFDQDRQARFDAESALRSAYETDEASRLKEIQAIQDAATTQESLKNQVAQGLITVGEAERMLDQRGFDAAYQDYLDQRTKPYDDLNFLLGLASGVPTDTTAFRSGFSESRTPAKSAYAQALAGLGSLGSAYALSR